MIQEDKERGISSHVLDIEYKGKGTYVAGDNCVVFRTERKADVSGFRVLVFYL